MAHRIVKKRRLNPLMCKIVVEAPLVASAARPGQFVIIRIDEKGERIPLTISDSDAAEGTITLIFQQVGKTTNKLCCLKANSLLADLLGPLGKATDFGKPGKVVLVAGGVGIAEALPIAKYAKASGNYVLTIIGARTKKLVILEDEVRKHSDRLIVTTDDGSYGVKSLVTVPLGDALASETFDLCYSVGPDIMMKAVCEVTKKYNVKTLVSLDANMVDATGMCGTCRVSVGGKTKFVCVDGPEFDGHLVAWDEFMKRQRRFVNEEKSSLELFASQHKNCMYKA